MAKFSFGTDPEFMLRRNGKFISAIGIVPGTKEKQHKIGSNSFYYDNVMAECTVEPGADKASTINNIRKALQTYAKLVSPARLVAQASAIYDADQLKHKDAIAIGCSRETCAYTLTEPDPPEDVMKTTGLRSAGGHIHIGCPFAQDTYGCLHVIRMMDLFIGIPSIFIDHDSTSKRRKKLYGKAGRFRKPKWGAEYRSIGNFWLTTPKMCELVYDLVNFTLDFCDSGKHNDLWFIDVAKLNDDNSWNEDDFDPVKCHQCKGYDPMALRCAIDNMDQTKGQVFMDMIKKLMPPELYGRIEAMAADKTRYELYESWGIRAA